MALLLIVLISLRACRVWGCFGTQYNVPVLVDIVVSVFLLLLSIIVFVRVFAASTFVCLLLSSVAHVSPSTKLSPILVGEFCTSLSNFALVFAFNLGLHLGVEIEFHNVRMRIRWHQVAICVGIRLFFLLLHYLVKPKTVIFLG